MSEPTSEEQDEVTRLRQRLAGLEAKQALLHQQAEVSAQEAEAQAERTRERHEQDIRDMKQRILIQRAQRDPAGYAFDMKHRHLFEVTDEEAERELLKLNQAQH